MAFDWLAEHARRYGARPALWFNNRWYGYRELNQRANRLASRLAGLGIGPGDRVGIMALNHPAFFDLLFAAPKLGFIFVPFNYRLTGTETRRLVDMVYPSLIFCDTRHQAVVEPLGVAWTRLSDYADWLAVGDPAPRRPVHDLKPDDTHLILFTGGSTGLPKGAELPYRQTLANVEDTVAAWALSEADATIQATPCFHAGLMALALPLLYAGGRVVLTSQFRAHEYLEMVEEHRVSVLFLVPTMYQMLTQEESFGPEAFGTVRWAISGGAACPAPVRLAFERAGVAFRQGFGMTEVGVNCFSISAAEAARRPDAVGRPMPRLEARVRDPDGRPVAPGEVGELTFKGPQVFKGYWQQPDDTAIAIDADGWLWSGDLARQDAEGLYSISGRRKEMYISGGENVYPLEVETAIYALPEVAEVAAMGYPHARWGEHGLAGVALHPGSTMTADALRAALKPLLAPYKIPSLVFFLPTLPKTPAGKISKTDVRRLFEEEVAAGRLSAPYSQNQPEIFETTFGHGLP